LACWQWGGGWLKDRGFHDFAGSTLVHSVGGWAALAGVISFWDPASASTPTHGSSSRSWATVMPLADIGMLLLWLGWFGFNGGSVLSADPGLMSLVIVTTTLAGAAGVISAAMVTSWVVQKKPDLTMVLNGILAGLVGITAGADVGSPCRPIIIGGDRRHHRGVLRNRLRPHPLDDPGGRVVSVHLVCGVWGTLAVGLFGAKAGGAQLLTQAIGVASIGAFSFLFSLALFAVIKATMGLRVSVQEEIEGLDLGEHGYAAYPDFHSPGGLSSPVTALTAADAPAHAGLLGSTRSAAA
jgi:Amt family ammonium transporter